MLSLAHPCRRPKGFGFIEFKDTQDAEDCVYKLDRTEFQGREITVSGAGGRLNGGGGTNMGGQQWNGCGIVAPPCPG